MLKRKPKKYLTVLILGLFFVGILPLAVSLIAIFSPSEVIGESVSSSVTVGNALPTTDGTAVMDFDGDYTINQQYNSTAREVYCSVSITDENNCTEITDVEAVFYVSANSGDDQYDCDVDNDDCYHSSLTGVGANTCEVHSSNPCDGVLDNSVIYYCKAYMEYVADRTDTDADLAWRCAARAKDGVGWSGYNSTASRFPAEMATFRALDIVSSSLGYGTLAVGENTGTSHQPLQVYVTGNAPIGVTISGSDLTCTDLGEPTYEYVIPKSNHHYTQTVELDYAAMSTLEYLAQFNLTANYPGDPNAEQQQLGWIYFGLGIPTPSTAVFGSCTGTVDLQVSEPT